MLSSHPELEIHCPLEFTYWKRDKDHRTDVDLVERFSDRILYMEHLNHDQLLNRLGTTCTLEDTTENDTHTPDEQPSRIFFINDLDFSKNLDDDQEAIFATGTTAAWLQKRLNISPLFFRLVRELTNPSEGRKLAFLRNDIAGKVLSLDGFYTCWMRAEDNNNTIIWFSHSLLEEQSTYVVYNMPKNGKELALKLYQSDCPTKGYISPFSFDVLINRLSLVMVQNQLLSSHEDLLDMEKRIGSNIRPDNLLIAAHALAKGFYADRSSLATVKFVLEFLRETNQTWNGLKRDSDKGSAVSIQESLKLLLSEVEQTTSWTADYIDRCSLVITLLLNSQHRIALGAQLEAESTHPNDVSLITVAIITMLFLPGIFVSAMFNMLCGAQDTITNWYLRLAITLLLTVVVFVVWTAWRVHKRDLKKDVSLAKQRSELY